MHIDKQERCNRAIYRVTGNAVVTLPLAKFSQNMIESRVIYVHPGQALIHHRPHDIVLPVEQHPAFVEDVAREKLPHGNNKFHREKQAASATVIKLFAVLEDSPATINEMSQKTGIHVSTITNCMYNNPGLFAQIKNAIKGPSNRHVSLYKLADEARTSPRISKALEQAPRRETGAMLGEVVEYLKSHGASTLQAIVDGIGASEAGVFKLLKRHTKLFKQTPSPTKKSARRVVWEYQSE